MFVVNLSRRKLLRFGVLTGSAVLFASQTWRNRWREFAKASPVWEGKKLMAISSDEACLLSQIAGAMLPVGDQWPTIHQAQVIERLDEELFFVSEQILSDFKLALSVVNTFPLLYGHGAFFASLPLEQQRACLRKSEDTRLESVRGAINACRMAIHLLYFGHESTWQAMGYGGPFARLPQQLSPQRIFYRNLTEVHA